MTEHEQMTRHLNQITKMMSDTVYWLDHDFRFLGINQAGIVANGASGIENFVGKTVQEVYSPNIAERLLTDFNYVISKQCEVQREHIIEDVTTGRQKHFIANIAQLYDLSGSENLGIIVSAINITEKKESEKLSERQQIFNHIESIAELIPAPFYWVDLNGRFVGLNNLVLYAVGASNKDYVIGKTYYELYGDKEIGDKIHEDTERVIKTGKMSQLEDEIVDVTTGKTRYYMATRAPLRSSTGEIICILGVSIEITSQKEQVRLEKELLALENKVYKATIERQIAFRKIMEQVMHDIRSPLMIIDGIAGDKNSGLSESYRVQLRSCYQGIVRSANYVMAKFEDINAVDEKAQPLAISVILKQVVNEKGYEYALKPHIVFDYEDKTPDIATSGANSSDFAFMLVQPTPFKRMMSNLINNAVDAISGMASGKVTVSLCVGEEFIQISVSDNGRGMTREQINKIESGISFTEGKENGHGIGMTQIRETIANNNGTLSISSTKGGESSGSSFILKFPRIEKPDWVVDHIEVSAGDTIVIVDDDHRIHEVWDKQFATVTAKSHMIEIKHFTKGVDAINAIKGLSAEEKAKIYLFSDFSLIGEKKLDNADESLNGVDVIKECGCGRSALVTYFCGDPEIHDMIVNNNTGFLPKGLLKMVTVRLTSSEYALKDQLL